MEDNNKVEENEVKTENKLNESVEKGKNIYNKVTEKMTSETVPFWKIVLEFVVLTIVFGYNIFVIFNNFSIGDGYLGAILAIIVDLGLIGALKNLLATIVGRKFKKINKNFFYIPFLVLILIIAPASCDSPAKIVTRTAPGLVNTILENNLGRNNYSECKKVKITDEIVKDTFYYGYAILENGNKLQIGITYSKANNHVYVELM